MLLGKQSPGNPEYLSVFYRKQIGINGGRKEEERTEENRSVQNRMKRQEQRRISHSADRAIGQ